jgi:catechol 2,3-dioxygenase-like lactoylglutathione lyase family enzyme
MTEEPKPVTLQSHGGCWFRSDGCSVHVGIDPSFRPQKKAHPAFAVEDLRDLADRLKAAGHEVRWNGMLRGIERFYTEDPFGNRLEFVESDLPG